MLVSPLEIIVDPLKKPLPVLMVSWTVAPFTVAPLYQVPVSDAGQRVIVGAIGQGHHRPSHRSGEAPVENRAVEDTVGAVACDGERTTRIESPALLQVPPLIKPAVEKLIVPRLPVIRPPLPPIAISVEPLRLRPALLPLRVPPELVKSTELLANAAIGSARASKANSRIALHNYLLSLSTAFVLLALGSITAG